MSYINLNGKISSADKVEMPVDNGAFRYGYGLFETMLVIDGTVRLGEYHWARLFSGLQQLFFELPSLLTREKLEEEVLRAVSKNNLSHLCRVRLQLFAGGGGLYNSATNFPHYLIECFPLEPANIILNENGLTIGVASGLMKSIDSLSNLKSCNALIYVIAAKQARENKWNDALLCNTDGNIIESTIANLFWIKGAKVYTPPLSEGCISGVMRRFLLDTIEVEEKSLNTDELMDADEVFLTNSIRMVRWVKTIGEKQYTNMQTLLLVNKIVHKLNHAN